MKGQYLAVESVLTFGLGLIAAVGIIATFETFSSGVYDTAEGVEAQIVQDRVMEKAYSIQNVEGEAVRDLDLPENIANSDYRVNASGDLYIEVGEDRYEKKVPFEDSFEGSASGDSRIIKSDEGYRISDR